MRTLFLALRANTRYKVDFSVVPVAIVIIELSVFITQIYSNHSGKIENLIFMRLIHTIFMIFISELVSQTYKKLKKFDLNYQTLALTGVLVMAIGDISHGYLASRFGVELISNYRRIGIFVFQGSIWFPVFVIVAGNRQAILQGFKDYEQRLITATRGRSRTSNEISGIKEVLESEIRSELYASCASLRESILEISNSPRTLSEKNLLIRPFLAGEDLRRLSRRLEVYNSGAKGGGLVGKNLRTFNLLLKQFRILYKVTVRNSPLRYSAYAFSLIALVTPPYINYYSPKEALFSYPFLLIFIFVFTRLVTKIQSGRSSSALRNSSILIYITGLLPFAINLLGQAIIHDPKTQFPALITVLALPLTYYLFMEAFQILRPSALSLIGSDELKASGALQAEISKIVNDEYSQTLSHQWAVFIHGKILTRLAATSLKLESTSSTGDAQAFESTVNSLKSLLSSPDMDFEATQTDLKTSVTSRLKPWIGLLDIDLYIDPELETLRSKRVDDLAEVIEELISNSIRHGKAKKIDLKILSAGEKDVEIVAVDNATTPPSRLENKAGLGTRIFNLASDGRWSINRIGTSTEFRLTMGIRA
jgi:two-component sensor histidine kinase